MNNLLSYCGLVDVRVNASDKDLPVLLSAPNRSSSKGKKDGKFAYKLVPDKCKNALTKLIAKQEEIGIHLENQFVFAKKRQKEV